jgi:hypothetical protein
MIAILLLGGVLLGAVGGSIALLTREKDHGKPPDETAEQEQAGIPKEITPSIEYYPKEGIAPEIYNKSSVEYCELYDSNHLMSFSINDNNNLQMAETIAQYIYTNRKGESEIRTAFAGTFSTLNTPKPLDARSVVNNVSDLYTIPKNTAYQGMTVAVISIGNTYMSVAD